MWQITKILADERVHQLRNEAEVRRRVRAARTAASGPHGESSDMHAHRERWEPHTVQARRRQRRSVQNRRLDRRHAGRASE